MNWNANFPVRVDWLPYRLDIPSFLGSARLDDTGRVIEEQRNAHQWRRVRYSYMDCRRQARKRGLVIRGPQKIWDSTLAACGMLYAKRQGDAVFRRYHDTIFRTLLEARARHRGSRRDRRGVGGSRRRSGGLPGLFGGPGACRSSTASAAPPRRSGCSACRALYSTASCSGAASTCPTSARCSARRRRRRSPIVASARNGTDRRWR